MSKDTRNERLPNTMIGPSLLACDFAKLGDESVRMVKCGADYLHYDVMDGHFVPNITVGAPVLKCLRNHLDNNVPNSDSSQNVYLDCHMMVSDPAKWLEDFAKAGATLYTFHIEAVQERGRDYVVDLIQKIKKHGLKAGVGIKPATPIDAIEDLVELVDVVLIMTVEPGFGGQKFMEDMMPKVKELRKRHPHLNIEVDGGLSPSTIDHASCAGANMIVAGSSVFSSDNPTEVITNLKNSVNKAKQNWPTSCLL